VPALPRSVPAARGRLIDALLGAARLQVGIDPVLIDLTRDWLAELVTQNSPGARDPNAVKEDGRRLFRDARVSDALVDKICDSGLPPSAFVLVTPSPAVTVLKTRATRDGRKGETLATFTLRRPASNHVRATVFARLAADIAGATQDGDPIGGPTDGQSTSALDVLIAVQQDEVPDLAGPFPTETIAAALADLASQAGAGRLGDMLYPISEQVARLLDDTAGVVAVTGVLTLPPAETVPRPPGRLGPVDGRARLVTAARRIAALAAADMPNTALAPFIG